MVNIGYIMCPSDISPSKYIDTCYKSETVSIITEKGQIYHECKIDKNTLQEINFPNPSKKELNGSLIIWSFEESRQKPIIIGTFSKTDEASFILKNQYKFTKSVGNNNFTCIMDGNGKFTITTTSEDKSEIVVRAVSRDKTSKILIESDNEVIVRSTKKVQIQSQKIQLGNVNFESAVLGETLKDQILKPLLQEIQKLTVSTAFGPSSVPINSPTFKEIEEKLENILSSINSLQ